MYTPTTEVLYLNVAMLLWLGVTSRALAFVALSAFNRDKMGLSTLSQMSIYWIVNPVHDWLKARRARKELRRLRESSKTDLDLVIDDPNPFSSTTSPLTAHIHDPSDFDNEQAALSPAASV
jgi:hypothetical protein